MDTPSIPRLRDLAERYVPSGTKSALRSVAGEFVSGRIVTYRQLAAEPDVETFEFDRARSFSFKPPEYFDPLPDEISRIVGEHTAPRPYVLEVPDVTLVGDGVKLSSEGEYISYNYGRSGIEGARDRVGYEILETLTSGSLPVESPRASASKRIDLAVPLTDRWADNYYHWSINFLTQIAGIEHYAERTGERPTLLLPADPPSFIPQSLDLLGFTEDEYTPMTTGRTVVERLVLPSFRQCLSGTSDDYVREPAGIRWLRRRVGRRLRNAETKRRDWPARVFVTRQDADTRRVSNLEEVAPVLEERGIETVVKSDLTFVEQKRLFRNADVVVGPHGAGLTDVVFADTPTVLELFGSYVTSPYYELSEAVGADYGCLVCEPDGDDLIVDRNRLRAALDALGVDG